MKECIAFSKTLSVMYVEDNEVTRQQTIKLLNNFFTNITVAVDGKDGLEKFKQDKKFDIIITDISMPNMNGIDMIRAIREVDDEVFIIIISAHDENDYLLQAIDLRIIGYLYKPLKLYEFTNTFNKTIQLIQQKLQYNITNNNHNKKGEDFQYLLNLYGDNVIASMTDTKGIIKFATKAYENISGYTQEELIGKPHSIARHPDMPSSVFKEMWSTIKAGKTWIGEVLNLKKDGGYYWVNATVSPQKDDNEKIIGYASIREDITLKKEIEILHAEITNMLDNIEDGFLTVNKNLKINKSHSKSCLSILNKKNIVGKNISDVLFSNNRAVKEIFDYSYSELLKSDNELSKELFLSILPNEHYSDNNIFTIKYKLLPNNECLVLLSDVTKQRALEKNLKYEQQIQKMIVVNAVHKKDVIELKNNFLMFLASLENLFENSDDMIQKLIELKRNLHTYKGLFAQKEMLSITDTIHNIETEIGNNTNIQAEISSIKQRLEQAFTKDLNIIMDILGDNFFDCKDTINIEISKLDSIKSKLEVLAIKYKDATDKNILIDLADEISAMKNQSLFDMLNVYPQTVENIAARLNKKIYTLEIIGDKRLLVPKAFKKFTDSLVHVFRNAIDHGIEDYKSRELSGKDMIAKISCSFKKTDNNIIIEISDDGKGIDIQTVLHKALSLGLISKDESSQFSKESTLKLIFENNFTTNENVDDLSGRGIGLSSVKQILDKLNGDLKIISTINIGTKFTFILPLAQKKVLENTDEETILNIILDTSLSFLKNDTSIEVLKITTSENSYINKNYSVLSFNGDINIFCILSIDDELLKTIFKLFIPDEISIEEKEELLVSFPDTVANTLVGRSVENFPKKYSNLTMSTPLIIDRDMLESFETNNMSISKKVETSHGEFVFTIIKMEN